MKLTDLYRQPAWVWKQEFAVRGFLLRFYMRRLVLKLLAVVPWPTEIRGQKAQSRVFPKRHRQLPKR